MKFEIAAFLDTETTTILDGANSKAFVCLYILNRIKCSIQDYEVGCSDRISYFFDHVGIITAINDIRRDCNKLGFVPVIGIYNLLFDVKSLMHELSNIYDIEILAKSTTNPYYIDLKLKGKVVLRFWDMFYLEQRGVSALGDACGIPKLDCWDYSLLRSPNTPLSDDEYSYASRDVQVLPAYLKWLLKNNPNLNPEKLGVSCLTKTSLVRMDAKYTIGNLHKGKSTIDKIFKSMCYKNKPIDYDSYNIRIKSFRGGFTFTAANNAFKIFHNVTSLDVTSMHHAFINGSFTPVNFKRNSNAIGDVLAQKVIYTDLNKMISDYKNPFGFAFNGCFVFENIRLKEDTVFSIEGIACLAETRFYRKGITDEIRDECVNGSFAFSKLIKADRVKLCLTEFEFWNVKEIYSFDSFECVFVECTETMVYPPEYVTLQSNKLFKQKTICKNVLKGKNDYSIDDISFMPEKFIEQILNDCLNEQEFEVYYINTIKGMFNGIYGTQAMNPIKDKYIVDRNGNIIIDDESRLTRNNFERINKETKWDRILYTYGSRIVGRSRTHLIIAMILLNDYFSYRINILGGDTDSIKMVCDTDVKDSEIEKALEPLHDAITKAIKETQCNIAQYSDIISDLKNVGCFEIETSEENRYKHHMEYWNKARISIDKNDKVHLTFAGLPSTAITKVLQTAYNKFGVRACFDILNFNLEIDKEISCTLEHRIPKSESKLDIDFTDYLGVTSHLNVYETIALYPTSRKIGDCVSIINKENYNYLKNKGLNVDCCIKELVKKENAIEYYCRGDLKLRFEME